MNRKSILVFLLSIFLHGCISQKPFYNKKETDWNTKEIPNIPLKYSAYLLGGFGDKKKNMSPEVFSILNKQIEEADTNHITIFLNDDVYGKGLPDEADTKRKSAEEKIDAKLEYLKNDKGRILFIPGDEVNVKKKKKRADNALRAQHYVENKLKRNNIFLPSDDCPGPMEITLTEDLIVVPLNTSYWLREKDERNNNCKIKNFGEWIGEVKDVLDNNQRKNILVPGHHPLLNAGNHGGFYSLKQHLFPLTELNKNLYVPLPVIGSLYVFFRSGIGTNGDIAHPRYKMLRKNLLKTIREYNNVVYASGHENNLQYFKYNKLDFIITNSRKDVSHAARINRAYFTDAEKGIAKLSYLQNGEVWLEMFVPDKDIPQGKVAYRKRLKDNVYGKPNDSTRIESSEQIKDSTILTAADSSLGASKFKELWLGKHYRNAWTTPVDVPLIDLRTEQGGLEILKKGGGMQTKSLRLRSPKGEEFYLRSVVKYPERLLGEIMLNTIVSDVVKDQTSTTHPYSPYVVDDLSQSAGILHSNAKMVFIPNDKLLAEYRKDFANTLALFEKRAGGKLLPEGNFGYAKEAIGSDEMLENIHKDNAVMVDDYAFLKSRLFDMWINDWDRHEGQWQWGVIECTENDEQCKKLKAKQQYYIPIPKDRDQAFAKFDGIIPWLAGRKWAVRKFQHFNYDIRDVPGLNFNARNIDHALLTELSHDDWNRMASELKNELTDEKIEHSIRQMPGAIYELDGPEIESKLKSRRDRLQSIADRYYDYLAKEVDVVGSDKKEIFEVTRLDNLSTSVKVFDNADGKKGQLLYDRTFNRKETNEVRLYGMGDNDIITITGKTKKGILIRVMGGDGKDSIVDDSQVRGWGHKTKVYDAKHKNIIDRSCETRVIKPASGHENDYDFYDNDYNLFAPATFFGYNIDDGLFLGGGVVIRRESFRKKPYKSLQRIVGNVAVNTVTFNLKYTGDFIDVFGKWGINTEASLLAPKANNNFFGLGNETERLSISRLYYKLKQNEVDVFPGLKRYLGKHHSVKAGPHYQYISIEKTPDKFITSPEGQPYISDFTSRNYGGGKLEYQFTHIDDSVITLRGIKWITSVLMQREFKEASLTSTNIESQVCLYIPFGIRATVAVRAGGATRIGDFEFYHANTLGAQDINRGSGNLRGYLRNRYSGRTSAYLNTDLRVKLFAFRTYLFPAHFGVLGFYDQARVWNEHEASNTWHNSFGGGMWFDPFAKAVINITYGISKEDGLLSIGIGFLF